MTASNIVRKSHPVKSPIRESRKGGRESVASNWTAPVHEAPSPLGLAPLSGSTNRSLSALAERCTNASARLQSNRHGEHPVALLVQACQPSRLLTPNPAMTGGRGHEHIETGEPHETLRLALCMEALLAT